jgi:hypothetical protein
MVGLNTTSASRSELTKNYSSQGFNKEKINEIKNTIEKS